VFADLGLAQELLEYQEPDLGIEIKEQTGTNEEALLIEKLHTF
jgi:hypothetical protein